MTAFLIFEQKMPLCWALLEISGLRRLITLFDPYLSENIEEGGGFE
jgi:hypothetical protein